MLHRVLARLLARLEQLGTARNAAVLRMLMPDEGPGRSRLELVSTWCLVALGLFFRARGVLFGERIELWNDESSWAVRMFERPLSEHLIRPPGYVLLTRLSAVLFRYNEFGFRLLPWLAGLAAPF